jgi:hypothetical protein
MQIGVVFPQSELGGDVGALRAYGEAVEGLGFEHLLACDHVVGKYPPGRRQRRISAMRAAASGRCCRTRIARTPPPADVSERPFVLPPRGVGEWHRLIRASDAEGGGQGSGRRLSWPWAGDRQR